MSTELKAKLLASLRQLKGRGTVGDVAAEAGLPNEDVRSGLKALLESHRGQLAVSDSGELLYEFDPRFIERGSEPWLHRARSALGKLLRGAFKAWIVVMLVAYFVLFVVLVIAALFASQRGRDGRGGGWGRGHRGGFNLPSFWFWYWIWGPRWRVGRPYYGQRWERTLDKDDKVPFYKKVFAFVFGPDRPEPTQSQLDRSTLRLIRARAGVLTTAELVEHSADAFPEAEQEMARLLGAYGGEALVSPDGELVYAFPEIMASAQEARQPRPPNPAWLRLEPPLELTGNTKGANAAVAGMNAFTLISAATAPWFIFPRLGLGGTAAFVGLVWVPVVFSVIFFSIPLLRRVSVALENKRRHARNIRGVLLGLVYRRALEGPGGAVSVSEAYLHVASKLPDRGVSRDAVERALHRLAAELDADVTTDDEGETLFSFPALRRAFVASDVVRKKLALEKRTLGEIVFATSDTPAEAQARDARLFDRALEAGRMDVARYVPQPDRVAFEDDFEIMALDQELGRSAAPERTARRRRG